MKRQLSKNSGICMFPAMPTRNRRGMYMNVIGTFVFVLLLSMMMNVSVNAASKTTLYKNAVSSYKKGKYSTAKKYFRKLPEKANESCVKKMPGKMKKAYLNVVKKYRVKMNVNAKPYLWGYFLTDIDKDKKPELLVEYGTCEADVRTIVYTYKNGKAKKVGSFFCAHTGFYTYPLGNGMMVMQGHMGYESLSLVKLKNGKLMSTAVGKGRDTLRTGGYVTLPYSLDSHIRWDKNYNRSVNYKPLQ
ncbi:MAG: hypothetical protein Q4C59_01785 [Lachnospiraceae bacterium]|nr:hypothetical protein [Lachnospiraceae bacterium]